MVNFLSELELSIVNTMPADGLSSASAVLFLTCFLWNIAVAAPDGYY